MGAGRVEDEAGFLLHRATGHDAVSFRRRHFDLDIHVGKNIAETDLHRAVEGQPHGSLAAVLNDIGY